MLKGYHHLTAISADARGNLAFYARLLGMRLVKKTVNQDDVSAYHLFYADGLGAPGSDLTFFIWPSASERRGTGSITETGLRVADEASLDWWREHLRAHGVEAETVADIGGRPSLRFTDPEGQRLRLVADAGHGPGHPWAESPLPSEHQIRGLGPITISVPQLKQTAQVLTGVLGMEHRGSVDDDTHHLFSFGDPTQPADLIVKVEPGAPRARAGAGAAHHVAFSIDDSAYDSWAERLAAHRIASSGPVDRFYFRSLYFREPSGILFEIATVGPGFTADEPLAELGQRLSLPPFLEARRAEIEAGLEPL